MKNSNSRGLFITLEGIEGAGKSTHMDYIADLLRKQGKDVVVTREPGGTHVGNEIRSLLLFRSLGYNISENTELLLMFSARQQHLDEIILPALADGKTVLCDRFIDSSYAYQGGGRGIDSNKIQQLEEWVQNGLKPHITILFDVDVELGLKRASIKNETDRFESETAVFFQSVRDAYLGIADAEPDRVKIIDTSQDIESVQDAIKKLLKGEGIC
jgi:dTMP kinase